MIRSELLQALSADNPDLRPEEVEQVVDIFFDEIAARLAEGGRVELRGFGTFSTRLRDARTGRNPRTGAPVDVPSKRVPYFKPGKEMRERLNTDLPRFEELNPWPAWRGPLFVALRERIPCRQRKGARPSQAAPLSVGSPPLQRRGGRLDQNFRSTASDQVRGRPGTPVTRPSEVVTSLIVWK
jgi:integration host factor subunit beta